MWRHYGRRLLAASTLVLLTTVGLTVPARAQTTNGVIAGTVADALGGVLPGVTLAVRNTASGQTRSVVTEGDGHYRVAALPPGTYELKAELAGFAPATFSDLTLTIGLELKRDVILRLQGVQESLTVTGQAPVVETTKSEVSGVITQQQIESLPISSRQPLALALLMPGTSQDAVRPRKFNATIGAGTNYFSSTYLVDGAWNKEQVTGEPRQDYPQAAIREFKVNVSQASAEYGGTSGGVITIATKSGTNAFGGEAFEFFRDKSLNAMNKFEQQAFDTNGTPKPNFRRNQYGAAFGGPIVKDRLHFFTAIERTKQDQYATVTTGKPQFYSSVEGSFITPNTDTMAFARVDAQLTPQQSFFARVASQADRIDCENCGGKNAVPGGTGLEQPRWAFVAAHTWIVSNSAVNEVLFQRGYYGFFTNPAGAPAWHDFGNTTSARLANQTVTYNFPSLTWGATSSSIVLQYITEIRDTFTLNKEWHGSHNWKMGLGYMHLPGDDDFMGNPLGVWTFSADQPFNPRDAASLAGLKTPLTFTASLPPIIRHLPNEYVQAYVQDEWKPRSNVTLNLGMRYDLQAHAFNQTVDPNSYAVPIPYIHPSTRGDHNNLGPRTGLAWDLQGNGRSVVRGGYGTYFQPYFPTNDRPELSNFKQVSLSIRNPTYPDPYGGKAPLTFAATGPQNIGILSDQLRNPTAHAVNAGFSQELHANMAVHADVIYTKTSGIAVTTDINPRSGGTTGNRPLAQFQRIDEVASIGETEYRSLLVRLEKRFEKRHQYLLSYTLAKTNDSLPFSGTAATTRVTDAATPGLDAGPGNTDRRHAFVASGSVLLPGDVTFGAVWTIRSGMPFSALAGSDLNGDAFVTDYVPGTTRNSSLANASFLSTVNAYRATSGRAAIPASQVDSNRYNSVDIRADKSIPLGGNRRLQVIAQVFNVLGSDNLLASGGVGSWVNNAQSDSFGRLLQAYNRQQAEIAVRLIW